jgi:hypothetical protein
MQHTKGPRPPAVTASPIDAGNFDTWLADIRASFKDGQGTGVPCGTCRGCCTSSYFIHIKPQDAAAIAAIPKHLRIAAPSMPPGHALMGYDAKGHCPMQQNGDCSIYASRPGTCKDYDCRIFAAAGLMAGGADKSAINARVASWRFQYATQAARQRHQAVKAAAGFISKHAAAFPGGRVPTQPSELAILAIKVYTVFLAPNRSKAHPDKTAQAVIQASHDFETTSHQRLLLVDSLGVS